MDNCHSVRVLKPIIMKNYIKQNWFLLTILLVLTAILFSKCENEEVLSKNPDILNVKTESYKLKNGQVVNTTKTVVYNKSPEKTELTKQFTKVKTIIKIQERVRIDTVKVFYKDTIPCQFERIGTLVNNDYSLAYKSTQKGIDITDLSIPDSISIVTGTKRKWFLGKETQTIDVMHSNKLIQTDHIQHIEIVPKKKFWDTTVFKVGVGFLLGVSL